ncbi:speckle-type POZ protein A [Diachasma alloeum]|uniref:speckle-type POZ protein A n=1 Tax=Diachasma alloeum TaxID=454923 RepID=UPI0007382C4F|nr:speckle-type POZ protein A [Diachasma alloeum]
MEHIIDIAVGKSDSTPTKVDMNLKITKAKHGVIAERNESVNNWSLYCYFRNWSFTSPSMNGEHEITVQITWTLTESPNLYIQMSNFLMNQSLSDVTIVIGRKKIFAHKLILCAASPVIHAMLTSPMKEAAESRIVIKDVGFDVVKAVLKLPYTGKDWRFDDIEIAIGGLMFGEKYDMGKLKDLCESKLLKNLKIENVFEILDAADTHRAEMLTKKCMKFILDNKKELIHKESFKEFYLKKPLLMLQFMKEVIDPTGS